MIPWYRRFWVGIALRLAGLAILGSACLEGAALYAILHGHPAANATPADLLLAGILFLSGSFGSALTMIGGGLWEPVQLSQRWTTHPGRG